MIRGGGSVTTQLTFNKLTEPPYSRVVTDTKCLFKRNWGGYVEGFLKEVKRNSDGEIELLRAGHGRWGATQQWAGHQKVTRAIDQGLVKPYELQEVVLPPGGLKLEEV